MAKVHLKGEHKSVERKPPVNVIQLGNFRVVSETSKLKEVAEVFAKLVKKNRKMIEPKKDEIPMMFG